jgi:hypothetical protein
MAAAGSSVCCCCCCCGVTLHPCHIVPPCYRTAILAKKTTHVVPMSALGFLLLAHNLHATASATPVLAGPPCDGYGMNKTVLGSSPYVLLHPQWFRLQGGCPTAPHKPPVICHSLLRHFPGCVWASCEAHTDTVSPTVWAPCFVCAWAVYCVVCILAHSPHAFHNIRFRKRQRLLLHWQHFKSSACEGVCTCTGLCSLVLQRLPINNANKDSTSAV